MSANLLLRSIGRVLWFAVAGAFCMAIVGIVAGGVTGALISLVSEGALIGAFYAIRIGFWSGLIAFGIAGCFACLSAQPRQVFAKAFRLSWRAAIIGVVAGAILGIAVELL